MIAGRLSDRGDGAPVVVSAPPAETYRAGLHLVTVHPPDSYPGLRVVRCGPRWLSWLILAEVGQTVTARGGERMYGYVTPAGVRADEFVLRAGDRATVVREGLPAFLVEWRVERVASRRRAWR